MSLQDEEIAAMAIAAIAEENQIDIDNVRVISFREVSQSALRKYLEKDHIHYRKYKLGDELL